MAAKWGTPNKNVQMNVVLHSVRIRNKKCPNELCITFQFESETKNVQMSIYLVQFLFEKTKNDVGSGLVNFL